MMRVPEQALIAQLHRVQSRIAGWQRLVVFCAPSCSCLANAEPGCWETSDAAPEGPPAQDPAALPRDGIGGPPPLPFHLVPTCQRPVFLLSLLPCWRRVTFLGGGRSPGIWHIHVCPQRMLLNFRGIASHQEFHEGQVIYKCNCSHRA